MRPFRAVAALSAVALVACSSITTAPTAGKSVVPPLLPNADPFTHGPLHTEGRFLVDAGGTPVVLRGAQIQSYNVVGAYKKTTWLTAAAFAAMHSWGMNELRLPFSGCLLGSDPGYLPRLVHLTREAEAAGLFVVLALFADNRAGCPVNGVSLPHPYILEAWARVAAAFHNDTDVLFDLFNEPHLGTGSTTESEWNIWARGGVVSSASGQSVGVVGLDAIARTIRNAGAVTQPLVAEVVNVDDLTGITRHLLDDTNVIYSVHTYFQGDLSARFWGPMFGSAAASIPVFVGEWAFLPNALGASMCTDLHLTTTGATLLVNHFLAYLDAHEISYNAWSFTPTHLIVDEVGFAPTTMPNPLVCNSRLTAAGMGALYKAHLAALTST